MGINEEKSVFNFVVRLIIFAIKNGKLDSLIELVGFCLKEKLSWDEIIDRANDTFYEKQVENATEVYKEKVVFNSDPLIHIEGYERWKNETK